MFIKQILHHLNSRNTKILPKFTKISKVIFFVSILSLTLILTTSVFAQISTDTINSFQKKQAAIGKGNNQESWMNEAAGSNVLVGINALVGPIPKDVLEGKNTTSWIPGGIISATNKSIASLYNPPFSGIEYLASIKNDFLGKPAYAQSNGFQGLSALIPIWKGFRNITYGIFSIVFIIMGIMIMLRVKITPQAVITIQNSIPKLITALILITFSYAIVGLLIDLSYVFEAIFLSLIFNASGGNPFASGAFQPSFNDLMKNQHIWGITQNLIPFWLILSLSGLISVIIGGIAAIVTSGPGFILGFVALGIILLVTLCAATWYIIKFFFGLIKCYVSIILKTIIGPLEIALGAIPNMKMGFSSWFVDIFANILVFPITMIFITLLNTLINATAGKDLWMPPGLTFINDAASITGKGILPIAFGLGGLMLISKLPKMIPEFVFQIKPSPWGKAIGEGFEPYGKWSQKGAGAATGYVKYRFMKGNTSTVVGNEGNFSGGKSVGGWKEKLFNKWDPRVSIKK